MASFKEVEQLQVPLQDILLATNKFAEENVIALGGFGKVYEGQSKQLGSVAIKRLDRRHGQGDHEFMTEIALLSAYKHENIVSLVGFCNEGDEKILVYKHERNGSLDKHIRCKDLNWVQRLQICIDAGRGLKYLHDEVGHQHRILHRDVKSSNILLDENWKAKISDFGLSKIGPANVKFSLLISHACGTIGYVAPEYLNGGVLTQKSDVYSFGVVLFEVLCGRLAYDTSYQDERQLLFILAQKHYERKTLLDIVHPDLQSQISTASLHTFSTIAYRCLSKHMEDRPKMSSVVKELEKALDYQLTPSGARPHVYDSFGDQNTDGRDIDDRFGGFHEELPAKIDSDSDPQLRFMKEYVSRVNILNRQREMLTLKGNVEAKIKWKNIDCDSIYQSYSF